VRGTPITVQQLGKECPRPAALTGKLITVLASDERFQLQELGGDAPTVQMRGLGPPETLSPDPKATAAPRSTPADSADQPRSAESAESAESAGAQISADQRRALQQISAEKWLSRCILSLELRSINGMETR